MKANNSSERVYIYGAVFVPCVAFIPLVGWSAAGWSWLQIITVVELIKWLGDSAGSLQSR